MAISVLGFWFLKVLLLPMGPDRDALDAVPYSSEHRDVPEQLEGERPPAIHREDFL